jgi:hypothetical protein
MAEKMDSECIMFAGKSARLFLGTAPSYSTRGRVYVVCSRCLFKALLCGENPSGFS